MDYANLWACAASGMAGLITGTGLGRKMSSNVTAAIEARLAAAEAKFADHNGCLTGASKCAASTEKYAAAVERLAIAIEKLAAAFDDHGAALVAAAVESNAGHIPALNRAIAKPKLA